MTLARQIAMLLLALMASAAGQVFVASSAHAAELLMFEAPGCPYCKAWHRQVGIGYPKSAEGLRAPLRVVALSKARDEAVAFAAPVNFSPTFVLVDQGREIGRIVGYAGADFFWPMVGDLIAKLDAKSQRVEPHFFQQRDAFEARAVHPRVALSATLPVSASVARKSE